MDVLVLMILSFFGYILMYRLYGKAIGGRIFDLSPKNPVPSKELEDGVDYVPTRREIIFGHHFTSIAGTGPIVGPAIAIIWGWLPAMLWVFIGSIIMGAVHDFGALIISMRNQGKSISEYTAKYINNRTKIFFFIIVFLELLIVIAIFGLVIAVIFDMFPSAVAPVWLQIPIAVTLGYLIYRKGKNVTIWSIYAVIALYLTMILGVYFPLKMPTVAGLPPTGTWTIILLVYAFIASVLPVITLLQPRDYINAHQLLVAMLLLVLGAVGAALFKGMHFVAPVTQATPAAAPPLWPFLFITIACGAISGFHALVSSGTSSKQVESEPDALFVGYGAMLMEAALATLVIIAVAAGIGLGYKTASGNLLFGSEAWHTHYASWTAAKGLGSKISAFVEGAANMMAVIGIPRAFAVVLMGVFVASFAGTTLDTATRIQRYIITELFTGLKIDIFQNKYMATSLAVLSAGLLAFSTGAGGKGALALWPLFGAVNQTLAALGLIVITLYLRAKGGWKWLWSGAPAVFMIVMTLWAVAYNQVRFVHNQNFLLQVINALILLLAVWIVVEGVRSFIKIRPTGAEEKPVSVLDS